MWIALRTELAVGLPASHRVTRGRLQSEAA